MTMPTLKKLENFSRAIDPKDDNNDKKSLPNLAITKLTIEANTSGSDDDSDGKKNDDETKKEKSTVMSCQEKNSTNDSLQLDKKNEEKKPVDDDTILVKSIKSTIIKDLNEENADKEEEEKTASTNEELTTPESDKNKDDEDDSTDEKWDLTHIFTMEELNSDKPIICMTEDCPLQACSTYVSSLDSSAENPWSSCIDCQENDFGGWPVLESEFPITFMTEEHREALCDKCTGRYSPKMPDLCLHAEVNLTPTKQPNVSGESHKKELRTESQTDNKAKESITQPEEMSSPFSDVNTLIVGGESSTLKSGTVTPTQASKGSDENHKKEVHPESQIDRFVGQTKSKAMASVTPSPVQPRAPSKHALAIHQKWQEAAKKLGGERIVVSKPDAKKIIFDMMKDSFCPMNITQVFKQMKGVVPSPVLKSCLDDMSLDRASSEQLFHESDEEDNGSTACISSSTFKKKLGSDEYAGALSIKPGRNCNTTLYYVDYTKLFNNGDGLLSDDRNTLITDSQIANEEKARLNSVLKYSSVETTRLHSEPTNADASSKLDELSECKNKLEEQLDRIRGLEDNAFYRKQLKKKVTTMAAQWRKRKRLGMDFLVLMEESTEGTVSIKKCFSGDGQIDVDSDEAELKGALEFAKKKRDRSLKKETRCNYRTKVSTSMTSSINKRQKISHGNDITRNSYPDENMIGVKLDVRGNVERVYLDDVYDK